MNDNMSPESLKIILEILKELGYDSMKNDNPSRPSIYIIACDENKKRKIYFNIPKNVNFVFQLIFENGKSDEKLRNDFAACLRKLYGNPYPVRGGNFGGAYLTIYLPSRTYIPITSLNKERIKKIIKEEIKKVCECYKKLKEKGVVS